MEKNRRKKVREMYFYIHANIVTKKWGEKACETIFPETQQIVRAKNVRKNRRKKVRKNVFYNHTNIVT